MPPYTFALPSTVTFAFVKSTHLPPLIWTEPLASYERLLTCMVNVFADAPAGAASVVVTTTLLPAPITSSGMTTAPTMGVAGVVVAGGVVTGVVGVVGVVVAGAVVTGVVGVA